MANRMVINAQPTEQSMDVSNNIITQTQMGVDEDPLIGYYANDPVIATLELDLNKRGKYMKTLTCANACTLCCGIYTIPCALGICVYAQFCLPSYVRSVANAHRLVLREKTLLYEVDQHDRRMGMQCCCCNNALVILPYKKLVRLADLESIAEIPPPPLMGTAKCCTCCMERFDSVTVKVAIDNNPRVIVDAARNADEFIAKTREQAKKVKEGQIIDNPPADMLTKHDKIDAALSGNSAGGVTGQAMAQHRQQAGGAAAAPAAKSKAEQLKELKELLDSGVLSQSEFDKEKAKVLAQ
eukprot:m.248011 g.248011  ORF g.248011 m.248011 type:complete len:297 (+) comp22607_c5_seq3:1027-1917(+)